MVDLTICIIGRNQGSLLKDLRRSLDPLYDSLSVETIYVDSCSNDDSLEVAKNHFDTVAQIACHSYFSASAGRYVATILSRGRWILYLDGDMMLHKQFIQIVLKAVHGEVRADAIVGATVDVDIDSGKTIRTVVPFQKSVFPWVNGSPFFGGALLIKRKCVIDAGNWVPWLFSFEERELLSRLRQTGCRIVAVRGPMVLHRTFHQTKLRKVIDIFYPTSPKFFGLGQIVLRGLISDLMLFRFSQIYPDIFVLWVLLIFLTSILKDMVVGFGIFFAILSALMITRKVSMATLFLWASLPSKLFFSLLFFKKVLLLPSNPCYTLVSDSRSSQKE